MLDLLIDAEKGIWHLVNAGSIDWAEFARMAARMRGLDPSLIVARSASELNLRARRPSFSALASSRGALLPLLDKALECYLDQCRVALH